MSEEVNKEQTKRTEQGKIPELTDEQLDEVAGGPARRTEDFGDPIGNYNFKVEIDGVSYSRPEGDGTDALDDGGT